MNQIDFVRYYLRIVGVITAILGLLLLLWPSAVSEIFFNDISVQTEFFARITGSTLIGYSVLNMLASLDKNRHMQEFAVWGNLSTLLIASVVTIAYYSEFDSFGWLIVGQHIFFGLGFVLCVFKLKNV